MSTQARDSRHRISQVGRYTIFGQIAASGAVMLHLARFSGPAGFSRIVTVKRLHPRLAEDPDLRAAFLGEARRISNVRQRNVVPTLDVVVNDTEVLQVMEHIHGASLGTLRNASQRQQQQIPLSICAAVMVGALHGLHAAHEAHGEAGQSLEIVHGGITPAQILVGVDGVPMVMGFGDGRVMRGRSDVNPNVPGDPTYLAPEQIRGEAITRATDIFAASIVLWELLAARWLFGGVAEHERRFRLLQGAELTPPSTIAARIPRGLDDVVMKGLRANPADRYRSALEMAAAIEHAVPCASQPVVGEWVSQTALEALAQQTEMLKDIEVSQRSVQVLLTEELADGEGRLAPGPGLDPPSEMGNTMDPQVVARPVAPPARDRRALVIGLVGATVFAALLAASYQGMRAGAFQPNPPPPIVGEGAPVGTTVIIRNESSAAVAGTTPPAGGVRVGVVDRANAGVDQARGLEVTGQPDAGVVAAPANRLFPSAAPPPDPDAPAPPPVLSRDTTLDPAAAAAAARALLRDRRPLRRTGASGGGAARSPHKQAAAPAAEAPVATPPDEAPPEADPADFDRR